MKNYQSYHAHKVKLLPQNVKHRNKSAFLIYFQPLLNLSKNWSFVTCITHLGRIHGKLFKLPCPQANVNATPLFLIKMRAKKSISIYELGPKASSGWG